MKKTNDLNHMFNDAKQIKKIQFIINTILANACYSSKEMETQLTKAENVGSLTIEEKQLVTKVWDFRRNLAKKLIVDLKKYVMKEDIKDNEKKQ